MPAEFSDEEILEVKTRYPGLDRTGPGVLEGTLNMNAVYGDQLLTDSFEIRITAANPNSTRVPALYEIGGRTLAIAKKYKFVDLRTLHRNKDGSACVCPKQAEKQKFPPGSSLIVFTEELSVPYLYGLAGYDQDRRWPWGEYSHGSMGLLEFYAEDVSEQTVEDIAEILPTIRKEANWLEYHKQLKNPSPKRACLCGSKVAFCKCHKKAWRGLTNLHTEMLRLGINPKILFLGIKNN